MTVDTSESETAGALRSSEAQYRAVVETAVDAIIVIDERGAIRSFNRAAERMFGCTAGEAFGRNISFLMPEPFRSRHDGFLATYCATGVRRIIGIGREVECQRRDGTTFPADLAVGEWLDGTERRFTGILRDLTARKRAEEEIQRLNRELEQRVEQRTRQLAEVNAELQAFAYSVSHDLRAPLRAMQGFSQALIEDYGDCLDATGQDYAERIVKASARMDMLIQDLLAYSRIGRDEIRLVLTALTPVVQDVVAQLQPLIAAAGGTVDIQDPLPRVYGQRTILTQVFSNLIANGLKFVAPGVKPAIRVRGESRGGRARIWVEDNGIGIARDHQARIFDVFQRLHGQAQYPGTGIGLAVVRKGIERLGGLTGVESAPGQGSRFWFELEGDHERRSEQPPDSAGRG